MAERLLPIPTQCSQCRSYTPDPCQPSYTKPADEVGDCAKSGAGGEAPAKVHGYRPPPSRCWYRRCMAKLQEIPS